MVHFGKQSLFKIRRNVFNSDHPGGYVQLGPAIQHQTKMQTRPELHVVSKTIERERQRASDHTSAAQTSACAVLKHSIIIHHLMLVLWLRLSLEYVEAISE